MSASDIVSDMLLSWWTPLVVGLALVAAIAMFWPSKRPGLEKRQHIPVRKE